MRTTGARKGKGNAMRRSGAVSGLHYLAVWPPGAKMSSARVLPSRAVLLTVLVACVSCAELVDKEIQSVKRNSDNQTGTNITSLITDMKKLENSSRLFFIHQNSIIDSVQTQPETEEDLVSEMEDLFKAMQLLGFDFDRNAANSNSSTSVSARMKMSDFMFNPVMLVPQLIMWGFAPIILANLKMFVMQALMLNKMALNAAIFMTLRNIVFGPRPGPVVKYENHGYHTRRSPLPLPLPPSSSGYHHHRRRS